MELNQITYKQVIQRLRKERAKVHLTKKEFSLIITAMLTGNWNEVFKTKIYQKYGGEYCQTQLIICQIECNIE
ncbi:hypothetical protein [Enterococcus sp. BWR-S5]|uniref:hypothetical protein n=1 Tax=Enterococcus sp. BWR-S5 TaxID=2787714 RepID=UPI0019248A59|nr:hypothetical protein [Enterococcus sp. BWR-S5]MBL1227233.1 hypothetical protein [Enterococcus sp. BWR-S5]